MKILSHRFAGSPRRVIPGLMIACMLTSLSGCSWFGGEEELDPPAELLKFDPTVKIRKAWSASLGGDSKHLRLSLNVATDGTNIFAAAHDGRVSAFEAIKGKRIWRRKTKLPLSAGPAFGADIVVLGSNNGDVIALNAADGKERWRTTVSGEVLAAPAVAGSLVLVRTVDGKLTALDIDTGGEAWFVQQSVPRLSVRGTGAPVVARNVVVSGFDNGRIAAYELGDGSAIWDLLLSPPSGRTEVERLSDLNATVRIVGEDVFAVGYQGSLSALALESGQVLWTREISGHGGIGVDFNNLYVTGEASRLFAVSRRSGRELWRQETLLNRDATGPAPYGSSIVVGDFEGYVHWFDSRDGSSQARVRAGGDRVTSTPLVVNEMVYVMTDGGKLFAFEEVRKK
ncbi:MAG: outer membrane protein assembly factor BamB [Gammaproteobacteria bacterium]